MNNEGQALKTPTYFLKAACSGSIAAWFTHFIMVPIDVVKTRIQLTPSLGPGARPTTKQAMQQVLKAEGISGLKLGLAPTNYGYLTQGFFKYGLYEIFKERFALALGQQKAEENRFLLYLASGMCAETMADVLLTPFEAIRIRMVADPKLSKVNSFTLMKTIARNEGISTLYRGFVPLVMRQVPYTAVKLSVFETTEEIIYDHILKKHRHELTASEQLRITAISGFIGATVSAVASHPADTILTKINVSSESTWNVLKGLGFSGLWTGLRPRMVMIGVLGCLQLLTYDTIKVTLFGLSTTQGIKENVNKDL